MNGEQAGMLLLAGTLVVATVGAWDLLAAGATREELRQRATGERSQPRLLRLDRRLSAAFERTAPGHRLQVVLDGAALPLRALHAALIALAGAIAGYFLASLIVGTAASVVAGGLVVVALWMWLDHKRDQRRDAFMSQLP